jgi:hypothetical protein
LIVFENPEAILLTVLKSLRILIDGDSCALPCSNGGIWPIRDSFARQPLAMQVDVPAPVGFEPRVLRALSSDEREPKAKPMETAKVNERTEIRFRDGTVQSIIRFGFKSFGGVPGT